MAKQRRDAERRIRQCERFARLIRITQLLLGHGRWGPDDLAKEIECSPRTIYRDIQTLSMAGIPIHFDKDCKAYRVPDGFRFPGIESTSKTWQPGNAPSPSKDVDLQRLVREKDQLLERLRQILNSIESQF